MDRNDNQKIDSKQFTWLYSQYIVLWLYSYKNLRWWHIMTTYIHISDESVILFEINNMRIV